MEWKLNSSKFLGRTYTAIAQLFDLYPILRLSRLILLSARLPSLNQEQRHGTGKIDCEGGVTWLIRNTQTPACMGIATLVTQRSNTLNDALAISEDRLEYIFLMLGWSKI